MMIVKVKFNLIKVNIRNNKLEAVFPFGNSFYRISWDDLPDRFKILYCVWLKLQGLQIPEYAKDYEQNTIDVSDTDIEIDLDKCEEVPAHYPLGG